MDQRTSADAREAVSGVMCGAVVRAGPLALAHTIVPAVLLMLAASSVAVTAHAQDSSLTVPAPSVGARLQVTFRPPARGVRRDSLMARGAETVRALVPDMRVDTLVPQTLRALPFLAVCAAGQADSVRLTVVIGERFGTVMIPLVSGLNRIALGESGVALYDGDVARWSLTSRDGELLVRESIHRRVVRSTPTINALARNGIWADAVDLFAADAVNDIPLASERLNAFLGSVGVAPCGRAGTR